MTEKELKKILRNMGESPKYKAMNNSELETGWERVALAIGADPNTQTKQYGMREYFEYLGWQFRERALRPLVMGAAAFVVLIGGWTGMVGAAFDTVPGDVLYPVKIANERAQLSLAFSDEQKARLHMEFASNRLDEAVAIVASGNPDLTDQAMVAIDNFTREITTVSQQIDEMKLADPEAATELALMVDRKVDEYEAAIKQTESDLPEDAAVDVTVAQESIDSADDQAVEVLVESHETTQEEATAADLQKTFQKDLATINDRFNLTTGRLASIEEVILSNELEFADEYMETVGEANGVMIELKPLTSDALNYAAAGGYRKAFEILNEISHGLDGVELGLASVEIAIVAEMTVEVEAEIENDVTEDVADSSLPEEGSDESVISETSETD